MFDLNVTGTRWISFYILILLAWGGMVTMGLWMPDHSEHAHHAMHQMTGSMGVVNTMGFTPVFLMWALMSIAMMAPTFVYSLQTYDHLSQLDDTQINSFYGLLSGYLIAWFGFSLVAAALQLKLSDSGLVQGHGDSASAGLNIALLTIAGIYQFSSAKEACLSRCSSPLSFFISQWRSGHLAAVNMGIKLGLICVGCCWALMLLGFVGGMSNIGWMLLGTVIMVSEKIPRWGEVITRPLGYLLLASAAVLAVLKLTT